MFGFDPHYFYESSIRQCVKNKLSPEAAAKMVRASSHPKVRFEDFYLLVQKTHWWHSEKQTRCRALENAVRLQLDSPHPPTKVAQSVSLQTSPLFLQPQDVFRHQLSYIQDLPTLFRLSSTCKKAAQSIVTNIFSDSKKLSAFLDKVARRNDDERFVNNLLDSIEKPIQTPWTCYNDAWTSDLLGKVSTKFPQMQELDLLGDVNSKHFPWACVKYLLQEAKAVKTLRVRDVSSQFAEIPLPSSLQELHLCGGNINAQELQAVVTSLPNLKIFRLQRLTGFTDQELFTIRYPDTLEQHSSLVQTNYLDCAGRQLAEKCVKEHPDNAFFKIRLADLLIHGYEKDFSRARLLLQEAAALRPCLGRIRELQESIERLTLQNLPHALLEGWDEARLTDFFRQRLPTPEGQKDIEAFLRVHSSHGRHVYANPWTLKLTDFFSEGIMSVGSRVFNTFPNLTTLTISSRLTHVTCVLQKLPMQTKKIIFECGLWGFHFRFPDSIEEIQIKGSITCKELEYLLKNCPKLKRLSFSHAIGWNIFKLEYPPSLEELGLLTIINDSDRYQYNLVKEIVEEIERQEAEEERRALIEEREPIIAPHAVAFTYLAAFLVGDTFQNLPRATGLLIKALERHPTLKRAHELLEIVKAKTRVLAP